MNSYLSSQLSGPKSQIWDVFVIEKIMHIAITQSGTVHRTCTVQLTIVLLIVGFDNFVFSFGNKFLP